MTPCLLSMPDNERTTAVIARELACESASIDLHRFPDGESSLRTVAKLADRDVGIVCTLDHPDDKLTVLLFAADLARDLGATSVGLLAPYLAYMRQDMRFHRGESVTAKYFAGLISTNFDWLVTVDPHLHRFPSLESIYRIKTLTVRAAPAIGAWIRQHVKNPGLIGPDAESRQWVSEVARHAEAPFLVLDKSRCGDQSVAVNVPSATWLKHCTPVVVDDIASTARTLIAATRAIIAAGGAKPVCIVVHPVFAGDAHAELNAAGAAKVVSCNTVVHESNAITLDSELTTATAQVFKLMAAHRKNLRSP